MNFPLLAFSIFLWNLLKIAYMLLTYRLGWIINQDRNYEWNLISHRYTYIYNNVQISFSLRCRRHHHHLLMLFISHSISISESNPSSASSLHIVWYFKLGVECHDGEKIGVQEKKREEEEEKREKDLTIWNGWSANELLNKAKAATSSEQLEWHEERIRGKSSNIVYNQFTVFYFSTKQKKQQQLNRKWETTTSRNRECDWQQKQLEAEEETIVAVCIA